MPGLEERLRKKAVRAKAKADRKNIKSKGKNTDAKNKGYTSQADKNRQNVEGVAKIRRSKKTKGPKRVSTTLINKTKIDNSKKSTNTSSGASSQSTAKIVKKKAVKKKAVKKKVERRGEMGRKGKEAVKGKKKATLPNPLKKKKDYLALRKKK